MSTMPKTPTQSQGFDPGAYYERAAASVDAAVKTRLAYSLIMQVSGAWGQMHLHRTTDRAGRVAFELVVHATDKFEEVEDQVQPQIVGDAISQGKCPLLAALRSSQKAMAAAADRLPEVGAILQELALAEAAANPVRNPPKPPRL